METTSAHKPVQLEHTLIAQQNIVSHVHRLAKFAAIRPTVHNATRGTTFILHFATLHVQLWHHMLLMPNASCATSQIARLAVILRTARNVQETIFS